ncbi:MAG: Flp pilus assembly protein CpaB [Pseudomonadota bacterium]
MRLRSVLLLAAAATCAGIATLLTTMRAPTPPQQASAGPSKIIQAETKMIVIARQDLPFGTRLDRSMLQQVAWPAKLMPAGAFTNLESLVGAAGSNRARVVLRPVSKGEPVLKSKISKPGQRPSLAGALGGAKSAVTIRVDDVQGVAGFIQPDDFVDVLLTRKLLSASADRNATAEVFTDVLLQSVKVLAVDQRFVRSSSAKPARAVTLEVNQVQAQKLVLASSVGKLSLTLKNTDNKSHDAPRRVSLDDLPGTKPSVQNVKPVAPDTAAIETEKATLPQVSIVRGAGKRQVYEVLEERSSVRVLRRSYVDSPEQTGTDQTRSSGIIELAPTSSEPPRVRRPLNPVSAEGATQAPARQNATIEQPQ